MASRPLFFGTVNGASGLSTTYICAYQSGKYDDIQELSSASKLATTSSTSPRYGCPSDALLFCDEAEISLKAKSRVISQADRQTNAIKHGRERRAINIIRIRAG